MTYGYIEDLKFAVEVFDHAGTLLEVLARLHELDGEDLRGEPIEKRKALLNQLLGTDRAGLLISQPIDAPADVAFRHICQLG